MAEKEQEMYDTFADIEQEFAEAKEEISDGWRELEDGKQELADGKAELAEKEQEAKEEISDRGRKAQINIGRYPFATYRSTCTLCLLILHLVLYFFCT